MNKYIKLIFIFIAIVAVIVGALYAVEYFSEGFSSETESQRNRYAMLSSKTESDWYSKANWDNALYDSQLKTIDDAYRLGEVSARQKESLKELVNTSVLFRMKEIMEAEMKRPESRANVVDVATKGLKVIQDYTTKKGEKPFKDDSRLTGLLKMSEAYKSIMQFANSSFMRTVSVNTSSYTWDSYLPIEEQLKRAKENHQKSPYYNNYFSKITVVKRKMDGFDKELADARLSYYTSVDNQLCSCFKDDVKSLFNKIDQELRQSRSILNQLITTQNVLNNDIQEIKKQARDHIGKIDDLLEQSNALMTKAQSAKDTLSRDYSGSFTKEDYSSLQKESLENLKEIKRKLNSYL